MAVNIDEDVSKFRNALDLLENDPTDEAKRELVNDTSRFVYISAMQAAELYCHVLDSRGDSNEIYAKEIKDLFARAIALMAPICDDYYRNILSRFEELLPHLISALFSAAAAV